MFLDADRLVELFDFFAIGLVSLIDLDLDYALAVQQIEKLFHSN